MQIVSMPTLTVPCPNKDTTEDNHKPTTTIENANVSVPRGHRSLVEKTELTTTTSSEMALLKADVISLESWWKEPRWEHTKRTYSGRSSID